MCLEGFVHLYPHTCKDVDPGICITRKLKVVYCLFLQRLSPAAASPLMSCLVSRQYFADFDLLTPEGLGCHRSGYHGYEYNPVEIL